MKKLVLLNYLLTAIVCQKFDMTEDVVESVVNHSNEERVSLAFELATTRFPVETVFNSLFDE